MEKTEKIMVVDDEKNICKNIEKILSRNKYEVSYAESAEEALAKLSKDSFSLLISDIVMPDMNGIDLLQSIRQKRPGTMVIIITGYASIETAVETARLGAVDYLQKPFTTDEIRDSADRALSMAA